MDETNKIKGNAIPIASFDSLTGVREYLMIRSIIETEEYLKANRMYEYSFSTDKHGEGNLRPTCHRK